MAKSYVVGSVIGSLLGLFVLQSSLTAVFFGFIFSMVLGFFLYRKGWLKNE